jgi:hypothetical protein
LAVAGGREREAVLLGAGNAEVFVAVMGGDFFCLGDERKHDKFVDPLTKPVLLRPVALPVSRGYLDAVPMEPSSKVAVQGTTVTPTAMREWSSKRVDVWHVEWERGSISQTA